MFVILLPQGIDTIYHLLDQLNLGVPKPVLVRDVIGVAGLSTRLTLGAAGLQVQLLATGLQGVNAVLGPSGQVNMDRGPHAGTEVGGARVDISVLLIKAKVLAGLLLDGITDSLDALGEPCEDLLHITALLHGDDTELVLLIDPGQEGLVLVVEDSATLGPVALHASDLQVGVARNKEEVVIDQLLADFFIHSSQGEVGAGKVSREVAKGLLHQIFHSHPLLLGDSGGQTKAVNGTTDPDPAGVHRGGGINVALDFVHVHVTGVDGIGGDTMVLLDQGVEDSGKVLVVRGRSVNCVLNKVSNLV